MQVCIVRINDAITRVNKNLIFYDANKDRGRVYDRLLGTAKWYALRSLTALMAAPEAILCRFLVFKNECGFENLPTDAILFAFTFWVSETETTVTEVFTRAHTTQ